MCFCAKQAERLMSSLGNIDHIDHRPRLHPCTSGRCSPVRLRGTRSSPLPPSHTPRRGGPAGRQQRAAARTAAPWSSPAQTACSSAHDTEARAKHQSALWAMNWAIDTNFHLSFNLLLETWRFPVYFDTTKDSNQCRLAFLGQISPNPAPIKHACFHRQSRIL